MKIATKITSILCDDVRQEAGNKYSLMGIYDGGIVFADFPALLPKLCLCVRMDEMKTAFRKCKVALKVPEVEPIHLEVDSPEVSIGDNLRMFAFFIPFRAKTTGQAKFEVWFDDRKRPSHVHKFEIKKVPEKKNSKKS